MPEPAVLVRNGWKLYAHPAFSGPLDDLTRAVAGLARKRPATYASHPRAKLLKRILDLVLVEVPQDPNAAEYQLGNTLGPTGRHWRRAKFLGRFRLFFRFSTSHRVIIYAWVNDETTLRKAGSHSDPYFVFHRGLQEGNPPDRWEDLLRQAAPVKSR